MAGVASSSSVVSSLAPSLPTTTASVGKAPSAEQQVESGPFEGPEKLLELWFAPSPAETVGSDGIKYKDATSALEKRTGLRTVAREVWEDVLDLVCCKVLSVVQGDELDALLLSESSMFIYPHKLILKTCGTTTLLLGLRRLLEIAAGIFGSTPSLPKDLNSSSANGASVGQDGDKSSADQDRALGTVVWRCFYSRKSFMFPERQKGPHKDWMLEVASLDRFFADGAAYTVGKMNGDHWLLYMSSSDAVGALAKPSPSSPGRDIVRLPSEPPTSLHTTSPSSPSPQDQTLEILMTHLDPSACSPFYFPPSNGESSKSGAVQGQTLSSQLDITGLFPDATLDAYAFDPCGYSANAALGEGYWTIHVTPEEQCSFASFETNLVPSPVSAAAGGPADVRALVSRVIDIFKPGRLTITLFLSWEEGEEEGEVEKGNDLHRFGLQGYVRKDRIAYEFEGYDLVYVCFEKEGFVASER